MFEQTQLEQNIDSRISTITDKIVSYRRDFHKYAESGWLEFRTASLIARRLTNIGLKVFAGKDVIDADSRMGLPDEDVIKANERRALEQGADPVFLEQLRGSFTGVVGVLECGEGPTIALRFDIDALELQESTSTDHRPHREGFGSVNENMHHACGHDCHPAVGLGLAEVLYAAREHIRGTVKFIFQPAEEGVRGAKSMVMAGVVDDVDFLIGHHVMNNYPVGTIAPGMGGYAATDKFDVIFTGTPSHAGGSPQTGKNALQAACSAVMNLLAIPRHGKGPTRINIGKMLAGTGRNVTPANAKLVVETRGDDSELASYMFDHATRIIEASARMYDCNYEIKLMGGAPSGNSDKELTDVVVDVARHIGEMECKTIDKMGGSEDFTYFMERVRKNGGKATNIGIGSDQEENPFESRKVLRAHTSEFDINEAAIPVAMSILAHTVIKLAKK